MSEDTPERGFKVADRRRFSSTGEPRADAGSEADLAADRQRQEEAAPPPSTQEALPEVTFSSFLIGISAQALILLGEARDPAHPSPAPDLAGAKHLIDIVGLLKTKTSGNLEPSEAALLDNILYDLRMKYVQRVRAK
jgi:hypothetical protein